LVLLLVTVACTPGSLPPDAAGRPSASAVFSIAAPQARQLATVVGFLSAFNSGNIAQAEQLVTDDVHISDCDYLQGIPVSFNGRQEFSRWLRERVADGDRIEAERFFNENPDGNAIGLYEVRRRNATLARLGFPRGIEHPGIPKVLFSDDGVHIRTFVFGSFANCRAV
jgi:hypothetical protein